MFFSNVESSRELTIGVTRMAAKRDVFSSECKRAVILNSSDLGWRRRAERTKLSIYPTGKTAGHIVSASAFKDVAIPVAPIRSILIQVILTSAESKVQREGNLNTTQWRRIPTWITIPVADMAGMENSTAYAFIFGFGTTRSMGSCTCSSCGQKSQ